MKIAPADIAEMKKNFDDGVRLDLPITAGHDNGMSGGELTTEQLATFKEIVGEVTPVKTVVTAVAEPKVITMSEAEAAALRTAAEQGAEALRKIEASERAAVVPSLMFSQTNTAGRFSAAQKTAVETFIAGLDEAQRASFTELIKGIPANTEQMFKELGDNGATDRSSAAIAAEVKTFANAKVSASETAGKKLSYAAAVKQV
jgi:hypothetical protein